MDVCVCVCNGIGHMLPVGDTHVTEEVNNSLSRAVTGSDAVSDDRLVGGQLGKTGKCLE